LAGQDDVVKQFADGEDVYSIFATDVYERPISKADPTERFVGKTCILGLGYGTGKAKLRHTLATAQPVSVKLSEEECERIVNLYRQKNDKIKELWGEADRMLEQMIGGKITKPLQFGKHSCVYYDNDGIILPNGMRIRYPNLRREYVDEKSQIVYDSRKGLVSIWGGGVVENVVQALARLIVGEQMVSINDTYRVALTVHDAAVVVVPDDEVDEAIKLITGLMSKPPAWADGLPVACEAKYGATYGDC
jgi:DNA polymerase